MYKRQNVPIYRIHPHESVFQSFSMVSIVRQADLVVLFEVVQRSVDKRNLLHRQVRPQLDERRLNTAEPETGTAAQLSPCTGPEPTCLRHLKEFTRVGDGRRLRPLSSWCC